MLGVANRMLNNMLGISNSILEVAGIIPSVKMYENYIYVCVHVCMYYIYLYVHMFYTLII